MYTLAITSTLSKRAKAAYTTFNRMVELAHQGLWEREVRVAWKTIKHPEYIWMRTMVDHLRWIDSQDPEAGDFLRQMALLWQCGVREDTTNILPSETRAFLARLAFLLQVHEGFGGQFANSDIGPGLLGWELRHHLQEEELKAPLPEGESSWESYIIGAVVAARLCRRGEVVANAERVRDYLNDNCLPASVLDINAEQLEAWLAASAQESAKFRPKMPVQV